MRFVVERRGVGEDTLAPNLFSTAWNECIELQVVDKETWISKTLSTVQSVQRYEIGMYDGDTPVGGITLCADDDCHVGPCLTVMTQYVLPEYRNKNISFTCMRLAMRLAKEHGYKVLAFTHRIKDWTYLTTYKQVR